MTKEKAKSKQKVASSYTYLTSNNITNYVNPFKYEDAENEILNELKKLFQNFGTIKNYQNIPKNKTDIEILFKNIFPNEKLPSEFLIKSKLKKHWKKEHLSQLETSKFWANFVFGFNSISRKLENGTKFDHLLIDKSLEDAPIIGHLYRLSTLKPGSVCPIISIYSSNKLTKSINTDCKRFGKLLIIGVLSTIDSSNTCESIISFTRLLASKITINRPRDDSIEAAPEISGSIESDRKLEPSMEPKKEVFAPPVYVVDKWRVNHLIDSHLVHNPVPKKRENPIDIDYLSGLKRVKIDQPTRLIRPPDQQNKDKKLKKRNKRNSNL